MVYPGTVKTMRATLMILLLLTQVQVAWADSVAERLKGWIQPHGFQMSSSDLVELESIIQGRTYLDHPALMIGVLAHVNDMSPSEFDRLFKKYPELEALSELPSIEFQSIAPSMRPETGDRVLRALKKVKSENPETPGSNWATWKKFRVFKSVIAKMDPDTREYFSNFIADSMANFALSTPEFKNVFLSKLYYFARYPTDELFSLAPWAFTDFTFARGKSVVTPMIFGTHPLGKSSQANDFGFYTESLDKIHLGESVSGDYIRAPTHTSWKFQGETFTADWSIRKTSEKVSQYIPTETAPPYQALWADGKLTGLVVAGVNLGGKDGRMVLNQYLAYFKEQGFHFSSAEFVSNSPEYFRKFVESGELDYFVKEAHSDGDEKIFIRIAEHSKVLRGHRTLANGKIEEIILMYPSKDADMTDQKSYLITNESFGEWTRVREKNGGRYLVEFNAGCWSVSGQGVAALEAAKSPVLIVYAAKTAMNTFRNEKGDAPYQFLHSFRKGLNFDQIRKNMSREKEYRDGKADVLLFTDDAEYKEEITSRLKFPIEIEVQIFDSSGELYFMDQSLCDRILSARKNARDSD